MAGNTLKSGIQQARQGGGGAGGADPNAIHDNVAGEITAIAQKATPVGADRLVIESTADGGAKRSILLSSIASTGLGFTTSTNPTTNAAVTTSNIDNFDGVVITLTTTGNSQTLQNPTDTTTGKNFVVMNNDTSTDTIEVNGETLAIGKFILLYWDGTTWLLDNAESSTAISVDTDFYADGTTGDNTADGLSWGTAWKNLDPIPRELNAAVVVNVRNTVLSTSTVYHTKIEVIGSGSLTILGTETEDETSIAITGQDNVATSVEFHTYLEASAESWTVNEHIGKFIKVTAGTGTGATLYPIYSNTATRLETITTTTDGTSVISIISVPELKGATIATPGTIVNYSENYIILNSGFPIKFEKIDFSNIDNADAVVANTAIDLVACATKDITVGGDIYTAMQPNQGYSSISLSYVDTTSYNKITLQQGGLNISFTIIGSVSGGGTGLLIGGSNGNNTNISGCRFINNSNAIYGDHSSNIVSFQSDNYFEDNATAINLSGFTVNFKTFVDKYANFVNNTTAFDLDGCRVRIYDKYIFQGTGNANEVVISTEETRTFAELNTQTPMQNTSTGGMIKYYSTAIYADINTPEYDHTASGMSAVNFQEGIDELDARSTILEDYNETYQIFENIASGTGGAITRPTGSTIILDRYEEGIDAIVVQTDSQGRPIDKAVREADGTVITTTFDTAGNYTLSGTPSAYPLSLVYIITIPRSLAGNVTQASIVNKFETYEADEIDVDSSGFIGNLSIADRDLQTALETVDALNINNLSTGLDKGGLVSVNGGDNTLIDVTAGRGYIIDSTTDPDNPTKTEVSWTIKTGYSLTTTASPGDVVAIFLSIDSAGDIIERPDLPTSEERRNTIDLGLVARNDADQIVLAVNTPTNFIHNPASQVQDFMESWGAFSIEGNDISPNAANLEIKKATGTVFRNGVNARVNGKNPHTKTCVAQTPVSPFNYKLGDGTDVTLTATVIDPDNYDDGSSTPAVIPTDKFTVQRISIFGEGIVEILYGQEVFNLMSEAKAALPTIDFIIPIDSKGAIALAYVILKQGATDLSDETQAEFFQLDTKGKMGGIGYQQINSAGMVYDPGLTNLGNGSIQVGTGTCNLFHSSDFSGDMKQYNISALGTTVLTNDDTNYVIVNYNSGSPVYQVTTDVLVINESDIVPVYTIYRDNNELHVLEWGTVGTGLVNKLHARFVKTDRFGHESGLALGEAATRLITTTAGKIWVGGNVTSLPKTNSGTDNATFWYHVAGVWTQSTETQYNNCFDSETELLTDEGFVPYSQLKKGITNALTLNLDNKKLEYNTVKEVFVHHDKNEMIRFHSRNGDILVTPEHRMVRTPAINHRDRRKNNFSVLSADEASKIKNLHLAISGGAEENDTRFEQNKYFFAALGLIISDGHFKTSSSAVHISQRNVPKKVQYIENILNLANIPFTKHFRDNDFMVDFYINADYASQNIRSIIPNKSDLTELMSLRGDRFLEFIAGAIYGDGFIRDKNHIGKETICSNIKDYLYLKDSSVQFYYTGTDKKLMDNLTQLCILNGLSCSTTMEETENLPIYRLRISNRFDIQISKKTRESYNDVAWCVGVNNQTLVLRRNSIVFIAGNTQYDDGTDLQTLGPPNFGVNWVYQGVELGTDLYYVLGSGNYTLAEAQASQPPGSLPEEISSHAVLVGRIIVGSGDATSTQIDSAFTQQFVSAPVTDHNNLSNLQGGAAGDYQHMTSAELASAIASATSAGRSLSTSLMTGADLSINGGDNTTFDIVAGTGVHVDNTTDPANPVTTPVSWSGSTANASYAGTGAPVTVVWMDSAGVVQTTTSYTAEMGRDRIYLGYLVHTGAIITSASGATGGGGLAVGLQVSDLERTIGMVNLTDTGNKFSAASTNLTIEKSAGVIHAHGVNYKTNKKDPSTATLASLNPVSFMYTYDNGAGNWSYTSPITNINPDNYDDGDGTLGTVPTGNWTIQPYYLGRDNSVLIHYGQNLYTSKSKAYASLETEDFEVNPLLEDAMRRGWLLIQEGCTDLSDDSTAVFVTADKFGIHPMGSSYSEEGIWSENVLYIGKHGNDNNSGENPDDAFLTFGAAIAKANAASPPISSTNRYMFLCEDAGTYVEGVDVPEWCYLRSSAAVIDGNHTMTGVGVFEVGKIQASSGTCFTKNGANRGTLVVHNITATGTADGVTLGTGGVLDVDIKRIAVDAGTAINIDHEGEIGGWAGTISINANDGTGVSATHADAVLDLTLSSIKDSGSYTGTTGVEITAGNIALSLSRIDCVTAINQTGGQVDAFYKSATGVVNQTGGFAYVSPGEGMFTRGACEFNTGGDDADFIIQSRDNSRMFWVDASTNRIGIGSPTAPQDTLQISGAGNNLPPTLRLQCPNVLVGSGQELGIIKFTSTDEGGPAGATIVGLGDLPWGGDSPGRLEFRTTPNGSYTPVTNMTIRSDGKIGMGIIPHSNMLGLTLESGVLGLKEITTPASQADYGKIYCKADNSVYFQDGAGVEHDLLAGGGSANLDDGTVQGQMAFWDNTAGKWTYTETSEITWNDTTKSLLIGLSSTPFGAVALHTRGGAVAFERVVTEVDDLQASAFVERTTNGDMVDGFGTGFGMLIKDTSGVENIIAQFGAERDGADNIGACVIKGGLNGGQEFFRISGTGLTGLNTAEPLALFDAYGDATLSTAASFEGSGLDDCTLSGTYTGTNISYFVVEIDATGTPDTFRWSNDKGVTWEASGISITGGVQLLENGVSVTFTATTGHTLNDTWLFTGFRHRMLFDKTTGKFSIADDSFENQFNFFGDDRAQVVVKSVGQGTASRAVISIVADGDLAIADQNYMGIFAHGRNRTTTRYGIPVAGWAEFLKYSGDGGMIFGNVDAQPIIFATDNTIRMYVADTGEVGIGTDDPIYQLDVKGDRINLSSDGASALLWVDAYSNASHETSKFALFRARGTAAVPLAVQTDDLLASPIFGGHDGTSFGTGMNWSVYATENWSPTNRGTKLVIKGVSAGESAQVNWMTLVDGNLGLGTDDPLRAIEVAIEADSAAFGLTAYSDTGIHGGRSTYSKARGTKASPTAVQSGDELGRMAFNGFSDATTESSGIQFRINTTENWSPTNRGATLSIRGVSTGTSALVPWMTLIDGSVHIGTPSADIPSYASYMKLNVVDTSGAGVIFGRDSNSITQNATIGWMGATAKRPDDTVTYAGALISVGDGTWTNTSCPARLDFYTCSINAVAHTKKMTLNSEGNLGIGTDSPVRLLHLLGPDGAVGTMPTNLGAKDLFVFENNGNGNIAIVGGTDSNSSIKFIEDNAAGFYDGIIRYNHLTDAMDIGTAGGTLVIDSVGNVGIGTYDPTSLLSLEDTSASVYIESTAGLASFDFVSHRTTSATHALFRAIATRGTKASPTTLIDGDEVFRILGRGHDGTDTEVNTASIRMEVAGAVSTNRVPGNIIFATNPGIGSSVPTDRLMINPNGKLSTGGETTPDVSAGGLCLQQGSADDFAFTIKNTDIAHGMTTWAETDTYFGIRKYNNTQGGALVRGFGENEIGMFLQGFCVNGDTTTSSAGAAPFQFDGIKKSGTTVVAMGATENVVIFGSAGSAKAIVKGNGNVEADGTVTSNSYDFAEYFESETGKAIPDGTPVILVGDKIREAKDGENPFGVISATAGFVGNQGLDWQQKYVTNDFGKVQLDKKGHPILNPDYDPKKEFVSRKDRKEWNIVGLTGQVYIKKGTPINPKWIFMKDANKSADLYLIK